METIGSIFGIFKNGLSNLYDANEIEALNLLTINDVTNLSKAQIKAFPEKEISPEQSEKLKHILNHLQTGEPIQYILGHTEFYGLSFKVDPSVLIPRPETEELVEWVLTSVSNSQLAGGNILDIGTGSGCIAISLKKNLPGAEISAIDISTKALDIAKQNADINRVDINFIEADILKLKVESQKLKEDGVPGYDIIVSNPPYVTQHHKTMMHTNVTDFEPHTALFVPEDDPLIFYNAIADYALNNLTINGFLFFEINESLGKETMELLNIKGFKNIELRKDMSGRDRMIKGTKI